MLKIILIFLTLGTITTAVLAADVFKCNVDGKIIYQQSPCTTSNGQRMDIQINDTGVKGLRESEQRALESINQRERIEAILNQQQTREEQGRPFKETEKNVSSALGAECTVSTFEPHDNAKVHAGVGLVVPGTNLVDVPVYNSTERCAQVLIQCAAGYGSIIVKPSDLIAYFADGQKKAGKGGFESFRLNSGESKTVFTCFGSQKSPIVKIEGQF